MNRRSFLSLIGLSWLVSISPIIIGAIFVDSQPQRSKDSSSKLTGLSLYVSPHGNDNWSGKLKTVNSENTDGPFATIQRARNEIRQLKLLQGGRLSQSVTVFLRGGTYFLSEPIIFTPEDSGTVNFPIAYKRYQDEQPIVSGGKTIANWRKQDNFWLADLPDVKTGKWNFRLLRVGNTWAIRARYPNFEPEEPLKGGWLFAKQSNNAWEKGNFNSGVANFHNIGDRLQWKIVVPKAGNYRVWVRYAQNMKAYGFASMDGHTIFRTGNGKQTPLQNLSDTGSFSNYVWSLAATIDLSAGEQTLSWENVKGGGISLDALCLTEDPNWNPDRALKILANDSYELQASEPGKDLLLIQAEACIQKNGKDLQVPNLEAAERTSYNRLAIDLNRYPQWLEWKEAEVHIFPDASWVNAILPVTGNDREAGIIYVNSSLNLRSGNRFFITNVRETLDSPNEWYLDKSKGELAYWAAAPNFPNDVQVIAPAMDRLFVLQGDRDRQNYIEHLHFQGITFQDTNYTLANDYYKPTDAAIWLSTARSCAIEDCTFTCLGGHGIKLEQSSYENHIIKNRITFLGQGGIILLGDTANQPFNNTIAFNEIHDCGQIYKHVAGVYVSTGSGNRIAHNHIYRMPRYGISLKSFDLNNYSHQNIIEFNEIVDSNLETNDTGAIETLGRDKQTSNNIIRYNLIRNVVGMGTTKDGTIISPHYTWGIYLDDYSSGTKVYGNIVEGTVMGGINIHGGKNNLVENNIFIDGATNQINLGSVNGDASWLEGNVIRRNIIIYKDSQATLLSDDAKTGQRDRMVDCDFNLYWQKDGTDLTKTQSQLTPEGSFSQWQAAGFDRNSIVANPLFVDPDKGDYRLKSDSPALKLGFKPIPIEQIAHKHFQFRGN
jgi:parallel beta-helix repeat protein